MSWSSFVAVGDSFTEGMDDALPNGLYRGWADLVAAELARGREFRYANLAVRGRLFDAVVDDQVPATMRMRPDLVSFAAGGNDVLRRKVDLPRLFARFDEIVRMLRAGGADVLLFRFADFGARLPGRALMRARAGAMNEAIVATAERHGAILVDGFADDPSFVDARMWSVDRLHLNEAGHRRVAAHVLAALSVHADPAWRAELPPAEAPSWLTRRVDDARWGKEYLLPWVQRRLTGRSSGDGRAPKRPELTAVTEAAAVTE